jgi:hypothetical protein
VRRFSPFQPNDLADLDARLLDQADSVVAMVDVFDGEHDRGVIGLRHDVDNVIDPAVRFAEWESSRGYRSTFYVLHTAPYWQDKRLLRESCDRIVECGHEIGIHNNAIAEASRTYREPEVLLDEAVGELRSYGYEIRGTVAHGDPGCYGPDGGVWFVNDEMFTECTRGAYGPPERSVAGVPIKPVSLADFGLQYDANWLPRGNYLSDSGGRWSQPFDDVAAGFPFNGQLHMLVHPDWWTEAFVPEQAAA